jgi:hypothetical protein
MKPLPTSASQRQTEKARITRSGALLWKPAQDAPARASVECEKARTAAWMQFRPFALSGPGRLGTAMLSEKIKIALDEARMLILGCQILLGFQFRSIFQDAYDELPRHASYANGIALLLMLAVAAFLIAPALYHRILYGGNDSGRLHRFIGDMMKLALLPLAGSLGLDLFIAIERIAGFRPGLLAGAGFGGLALLGWYGVPLLRKKWVGGRERAMTASQIGNVEATKLHTKIDQMLTEARVILPGAQALLGFQLAIVVTHGFNALPALSKAMHGLSLACIALTVILLMAPAAYHRIVYAGEDSTEFHRVGSMLVTAATLPLALGLSGDTYVVMTKIAHSSAVGAMIGATVFLGFILLWHVYPIMRRGALGVRSR